LPLAARTWPAIDPKELADDGPRVVAEADVEYLAREVSVNDRGLEGSTTEYYYRAKVFTSAGAQKLAKIDLPFLSTRASVTNVEARTIKPDGSMVELARKDIFEREVVRAGNLRGKVKSFAPPAVEPGCIVEYRYRYTDDGWSTVFPLIFETEIPARSVTFRFRSSGIPGLNLQMLTLNYPLLNLKPNRSGYYEFTLNDVAARTPEPLSPPAVHFLPSVVFYYTSAEAAPADKYWANLSKQLHRHTQERTRVNKAIKTEVARLVAPTDNDDEKLRKLHEFCQAHVMSINRLVGMRGFQFALNENAGDTLKKKTGTVTDVNTLFVALARAAGFDARLASVNDRSTFIFQPRLTVPFAFNGEVAAVWRGDHWQFFDPGFARLPAGMLDWRNCDTSAIIADPAKALIEKTASAPADVSARRYKAELTIAPDGTLSGNVTITCTGYFEHDEKLALARATPEKTEQHLRAALEPQLHGVELSKVVVFHADHDTKPLEIYFHLRLPQFAEFTGSRLFVQPGVFRRNLPLVFEALQRETTIMFPHRYVEIDEVRIKLPAGVTLEAGSAPGQLEFGDAFNYQVEITWESGASVLNYQRRFRMGVIAVGPEHYPAVRSLFAAVQERDNHTLTFRLPAGFDPSAEPPAQEGGARKISVPLAAPRLKKADKKK
jgi:hypothetical protein